MGGRKSPREFLDMSGFTDGLSRYELIRKTISNALAWDVFGGKTEFRAVVLSPPILLAAADADLDGTQHSEGDDSGGWFSNAYERIAARERASSGPTWQSNKFAFKARILGNPSPHDFLQDPCQIAFTENPQKVMRLISLHTTFITSDDSVAGDVSIPKVGDVVNVELQIDEFSYNLQFGKYTSIATATTAGLEGAPSGVSERLAQQAREAGADVPEPAPGGLSCFSLGALFVDFDADIFASDDGTRVRARSSPTARRPMSTSATGRAPATTRSEADRHDTIQKFWAAVVAHGNMPSGVSVTSRGRTVEYGRGMIVRMAQTRNIAVQGDGLEPTENERLRGILTSPPYSLAIARPDRSNHCVGPGCRSNLIAFDVSGGEGSRGTDSEKSAARQAISDALQQFKTDSGPNGHDALVANGTILPFASSTFAPPGWKVENTNNAVHIELLPS